MTPADEERAAVVAWLRAYTRGCRGAMVTGNCDNVNVTGRIVLAVDILADAIERGDHRAPATGKERGE